MKGKIFNAQEVQSILNGSKVMFREVIKLQPQNDKQQFSTTVCSSDRRDIGKHKFINPDDTRDRTKLFKCPYQVGQKIFCKESFWEAGGKIIYKADYKSYKPISPWRRAMKQEHSRLTLLIKEIKVERLADITPFDCVYEGIWDGRNVALGMSGKAVEAFKDNWNATHKKPEEKFEASPWVWCVSFEIINN